MKKILTLIILSFWLINCNGQTKLAGKTYIAEIGATCKDMADGGCMIYIYRILAFKQDSVTIAYRVKASCTAKQREDGYIHMYDSLNKTYRWKIRNNILTIENYLEINELIVQKSKIIGKGSERIEYIIFTEETGQKTNK